ncbi:MAG: winged helix-turn-helix domain-containing protein [Pseudonocardiaceae bacterium]
MEVEVLGPLTVRCDGERLEFGGPREQAVLACLVIHAGEVVSTETLVRGVWSAKDQPESPVDALRTLVSRLRAVLEPDRPRGAPSQQLPTAQGGFTSSTSRASGWTVTSSVTCSGGRGRPWRRTGLIWRPS